MQHAGTTLKNIARQSVKTEGADGPVLAWPLACGAKIAERATAVSFASGVLTVSVPDPTWINQLQSFAAQYLATLNQITSEKVDRINFVAAHCR